MKLSTTAIIFIVVGAVIMFSNLLQEPLGWPRWTGPVLSIGGALLIWCGVWASRRAKKRGEISPHPLTLEQYNTRLRLGLIAVVLASLTLPFYASYTGVTLPFPQLLICALVSCGLCIAILLLAFRRYRPKT